VLEVATQPLEEQIYSHARQAGLITVPEAALPLDYAHGLSIDRADHSLGMSMPMSPWSDRCSEDLCSGGLLDRRLCVAHRRVHRRRRAA
jgi:hypothetical protein